MIINYCLKTLIYQGNVIIAIISHLPIIKIIVLMIALEKMLRKSYFSGISITY